MEFKDRLKLLRKERGFTQETLAAMLNVSKQTISGYERGVRRPSFEYLDALSDLFDINLDYLLGSSDDRGSYPRHGDTYDAKVSTEELNLLTAYRSASKDTRQAVRAVLGIK
ncbi:MAG: helix-turn-helix transcriptional regulator [Lachnospiraceae bacterium]|nr:helix-turn-helix transcriptional regulator [Lachnospiraceae bacterium]